MNEDDKKAILDEIDALVGVPPLQPGDITTNDLMDLWGVTAHAVYARMKPLVEDGQWESHLVYNPQTKRQCRVYRKTELGDQGERLAGDVKG